MLQGAVDAPVPTVGWVGSVRLSLQSRLSFLVCRHDFQHKTFRVLSLPLMSPLSPLSMLPVLSKVTEAVAQVFKPCPFLCYPRAFLATSGLPCVHTTFTDPLSLPEMWLLFIFWSQQFGREIGIVDQACV